MKKKKEKGGGIYHGIVPRIKRVLFLKKERGRFPDRLKKLSCAYSILLDAGKKNILVFQIHSRVKIDSFSPTPLHQATLSL